MQLQQNEQSPADDIFTRYIVFILALFLILGSGFVLWRSYNEATKLNQASAIEDTTRFAQSVAQFRNFYSKTIVPKANEAGLAVTHDYLDRENALPLPATFAKDFGSFLESENTEYQVRLYSDKPFPWRTKTDLDDFEVAALKSLSANPDRTFSRIETLNGTQVLRFAQADVLGESCVGCHNNYTGTPKNDWKVGDVRGVLEITRPLASFESAAQKSLQQSFLIMLGVVLGMVALLFTVLKRLRNSLKATHLALTDTNLSNQKKSQEIERRKTVTKTLKVTEAKMRAVVNSVQDVIVAIDQYGVITDVNSAVEKVFGYTVGELVGQNVNILMGDDHKHAHDGYLKAYIKTGEEHIIGMRRELCAVRKDGSQFPIELSVNDARVDDEILFTGIIRDITHRKENEKNIAEAHRAAVESANLKSEFLANMSHEIRTPMNGVIGMTEMLLDSKLSLEQRNLTRTVHESAESLLVIINDILDFSKIEAGKLTIKPHDFQLIHMLEAVIDLLAEEASRKQINLALFVDKDVPQVMVSDSGRLRQILINLLGNALKFTEQGYVILHLSSQDGLIRFDVKDSGSGIPEEAQKTLFDAFSQVDGSSTREHGGTGLGLAICHQLVDLLGGDLAVESQQGEGSNFYFSLPSGITAKAADSAHPYIQANGLSVLMYSTDAVLNRYHERQMLDWDMKPKMVSTLNQCFSQVEAQPYDLIAIDADNLYYDPEHPLGALSLIKSIREVSTAQIVLFGSMQSFMSLEAVSLGDNIHLMQKPLKHTEIKLITGQEPEQVSTEPSGSSDTLDTEVAIIPSSPTPVVAPILFELLLAEDNKVNQMVATTMLKKLGYQVDVVNNGREALEALNEKPYDLIFMDCQMPVLDGYEATKEIRKFSSSNLLNTTPVIALTAHAMLNNDQKCFDAGMDDFLSKPVRVKEMKEILNKWLPVMTERRSQRQGMANSES
ncbi:response regulator [Leucothrix pacifica]|uniref:Sensor protein FixL n=1 Tax=Leucothrix pacifica TaxID=1247513 RepID=A0A317CQH6_9GAMM|nr:response regulator [Leucothrix pacifica]PWR00458.1 hypothetical protein DKW60_01135 [Leucothrix pacifica]